MLLSGTPDDRGPVRASRVTADSLLTPRTLITKTMMIDPTSDLVPSRVLRTLLRVASAQGYDQAQVRAAAGIDFDPWASDAPTAVPTLLYTRLYRHLMLLLQDEAFGLNIPHRQPPGTFRMMSRFIIHCSSLGEALVRLAEFFDFCDSFHSVPPERRRAFERFGERVRISFYNSSAEPDGDLQAQSSVLFMMGRFLGWLIGQDLPLLEVEFTAAEPDNGAKYRELFPCPVRFGGSRHALWVRAECLDWPIIQNEDSLRDFLRSAPYPLMTRRSTTDQASLSERIRALLGHDFSRPLPVAREIAELLNMSTRTLHRRLKQENTSYQRIKDECRHQAALAYIARPELTISAVAMLMGFQDASAFHRSFKKWTGTSPGDYRRRELARHTSR